MPRLLALLLFAPLVLAAPVPRALQKKSDEELLTGDWQVVTYDTGGGQKAPEGDFATFQFKYADGTLNTGTATSPGWVKVKVKLDPQADPKVMMLETAPGQFIKNIYKIDGDNLYWCEWQKAIAPADFDGGGGKASFVLKRVKAK